MKGYNKNIWVLITRSLCGEATGREQQKLHRWLEEDPDHQKFYNDLTTFWKQSNTFPEEDTFLFDYENGLNKLRKKVETEKENFSYSIVESPKPKKQNSHVYAWKIAAAVILLISTVSFFLVNNWWQPPTVTYSTTGNEQLIVNLPDHSTVRLNKSSSISFNKELKGTRREVFLQGEAFFEVTPNADRPFIIHTQNGIIRVLGTSFLVKERTYEELLVAVKEGTVSLRHSNTPRQKAVQLQAGQAGFMNSKTSHIRIGQYNIDNYLSWITGYLTFKNMPLRDVFNQLENLYDVKMEVQDPAIKQLKLTAYTKKTLLKEVLNMIAQSMSIDYEKEGSTIVWTRQSKFQNHNVQ